MKMIGLTKLFALHIVSQILENGDYEVVRALNRITIASPTDWHCENVKGLLRAIEINYDELEPRVLIIDGHENNKPI